MVQMTDWNSVEDRVGKFMPVAGINQFGISQVLSCHPPTRKEYLYISNVYDILIQKP